MPITDAFDSLLRSHDLLAHRESIVASSKPSLRMTLTEPSADDRATRFGGLPILNKDIPWPSAKNFEPLGFLAQINLADLPINPFRLPPKGLLSFFYETQNQPWGFYEDAGNWAVVYTDLDSPLHLTAIPTNSKQPVLPPHGVQLIEELTIPAPRSIELDAISIEEGSDKWDSYFKLRDNLVAMNDDRVAHRLFGHPDAVQGCMQRTIQFESRGLKLPKGVYSYYEHPRADELIPGAFDWELLLQIDSDDRLNVMWGDNGKLFFWMQTEAMRNRQWNAVWAKLQCH
jgi:uncharacterized protein YwqG